MAQLDLDGAGTWQLALVAEGFWGQPEVLIPGPARRRLNLLLFPVAAVTGRLELPQGEIRTTPLVARFQPIGGKSQAPPRGEVPCQLADERFRCLLPAGSLDLRLRSEGFVAHYFWDQTLPFGGHLSLGRLAFRRGASVVGWVERSDGEEPHPDTKVRLLPPSSGANALEDQRAQSMRIETKLAERGFFQLAGVPPGSYTLEARQPGLAPALRQGLAVLDGEELEVHPVLTLSPRISLTVTVNPPMDLGERPWRLQLMSRAREGQVHRGVVDSGGMYSFQSLEPGAYFLFVGDGDRQRVAIEELFLEDKDNRFDFQLPMIWVEGEVTLGGEPLAAALHFGGRSALVNTTLTSDQEGKFVGRLPRGGILAVDVEASQPTVFRRLAEVSVEAESAGEVARVDIDLPATKLRGEVVDGQGKPVPTARVIIIRIPGPIAVPAKAKPEKPSFFRVDEEGQFEIAGFALGSYRLGAVGQLGRHTVAGPTVDVDTYSGREGPWTRLVLEEAAVAEGIIRSTTGPIVGAKVTGLTPDSNPVSGLLVPNTRSGTDGRFQLPLPAGTELIRLLIMAPGFDLAHHLAETQKETTVVLNQGGGTLQIEIVGSEINDVRKPKPYILDSSGFRYRYGELRQWEQLNRIPRNPDLLQVPGLPADRYTVCWPTSNSPAAEARAVRNCRSLFVAPFSLTRLSRVTEAQGNELSEPEQIVESSKRSP